MDLQGDLRILLEKAIEVLGSKGSTGMALTTDGYDSGTRINPRATLQKVFKHQWLLLILPLLNNHPRRVSGSPGVPPPTPLCSIRISGCEYSFHTIASGNEMQPAPGRTLNANPGLLTYFCDNQRKYLSLKFIIIA